MTVQSSTVSEILIKRNTHIVLARVLTQFDLPGNRYPDAGVWSYLIHTSRGIVVFDAGPYYRSALGLRGKKTHNTDRIMAAIGHYFPNIPITEILISHYHFDHLQNAPDLQEEAFKRFGIRPPIRLHEYDMGKKRMLSIFPTHVRKIAAKTGYIDAHFGKPVKDSEYIPNTDFVISHTPGHTSGMISLVNHCEKIVIAGWSVGKYPNTLARVVTSIIDEDRKHLPETIKKLTFPGYRYYYLHKWGSN
jgi:glyoxylase-like metal-dependent hydrolase (beta-lactamase superfamily II)